MTISGPATRSRFMAFLALQDAEKTSSANTINPRILRSGEKMMNQNEETAAEAADKAHRQALINGVRALKDRGLQFSDCVLAFGIKKESSPLALAAEARHAEEGEIEVDDITVLSTANDDENPLSGYVMAWVWAETSEATSTPVKDGLATSAS